MITGKPGLSPADIQVEYIKRDAAEPASSPVAGKKEGTCAVT